MRKKPKLQSSGQCTYRAKDLPVRDGGIKKTASVASVFKHQHCSNRKRTKIATGAKAVVKAAEFDAVGKRYQDADLRVTSSSPSKGKTISKQRIVSKHPLEVGFLESTSAYKTCVLAAVTEKVNTTHAHLIQKLKSSNLQSVSTRKSEDAASPTELPVTGSIDKAASALYIPIGSTILHHSRTLDNGQKERTQISIEQRTGWFEAEAQEIATELRELQRRWEMTVGKIWKCGVQILGEKDMESLLIPGAEITAEQGQEHVVAREKESLFVPELDESDDLALIDDGPKQNKRVTFNEPLPRFLTQASRLKSGPIPALPDVPTDRIQGLQKKAEDLGATHVAKYGQLQRQYDQWLRRKIAQIEQAVEAE
ncbi:hypothetical protein B0J11DRAFT_614703 [Dendryphion nanum]|uniref:Uncharacterized protein n=1 Tax=Dendryphion nanum TaxID=256645 RepID=A0A9P9DUL0_9PLEO|nr:hypothetical protein B0J11DRAFT_614703 [Dendryphion nanum]